MYWNVELKKLWRILLLLSLPLLSLRIQEGPPYTNWFDKPFSFVTSVAHELIASVVKTVEEQLDHYFFLVDVQKKNDEYRFTIESLQAKIGSFEQLKRENNELKALLGLRERTPLKLLAAENISSSRDLQSDTFWINRGSTDGVEIGQAVLSRETLIGSIIRTLPTKSQVLLLSDRFSVIDVMVTRTQARGILEGRNASEAVFKSFEKVHDLEIGDELVSLGIDQVFPKGIRVGRITRIEKDP
ncbi:MAG: rod shape-determining protein MreC, partial [Bdellovibrionaceae bacterium]|nr:rod shape-determining protein MreC [Pseudobdellovibrionaceae bacterium]